MNRFLLCSLIVLATSWATAQTAPSVEWQRNLGGSANDLGVDIQQTSDGGYILCGTTFSNNGDVTGNHGNSDIWVLKLDAQGTLQWQRCLGGTQPDNGRVIREVSNGDFIVLGDTYSNNGDVSGNHGSSDIWLVRLDNSGELTWQRCYGGSELDGAAGFKAMPDGGFLVAGSSRSTDGDLTSNAGSTDFWVLRIDDLGEILWQQTYGGTFSDDPFDLASTPDGGCVVIGVTSSDDGNVTGNHGGVYDAWVIKLGDTGAMEWQRACGGSGTEYGRTIIQRSDGSFLAVGTTDSNDGDITQSLGANDLWTLGLSASGQLLASELYGGSNNEGGADLINTSENGTVYFGSSSSNDGDLTGNQGSMDGWLYRTDLSGGIVWSITLGGSQSESFNSGDTTADGGYIAIGQSSSNDGDLPGNNGAGDVWVVKLGPDPVGIREASRSTHLDLFPNPCGDRIQVSSTCQPWVPTRWQIIDGQGRIASEGSLSGGATEIVVSPLRSGTYSLMVKCAGGIASAPFVKE